MPGKGDLFDYDAELRWYREHLSTAIDVRPADRVRGVVVGQAADLHVRLGRPPDHGEPLAAQLLGGSPVSRIGQGLVPRSDALMVRRPPARRRTRGPAPGRPPPRCAVQSPPDPPSSRWSPGGRSSSAASAVRHPHLPEPHRQRDGREPEIMLADLTRQIHHAAGWIRRQIHRPRPRHLPAQGTDRIWPADPLRDHRRRQRQKAASPNQAPRLKAALSNYASPVKAALWKLASAIMPFTR